MRHNNPIGSIEKPSGNITVDQRKAFDLLASAPFWVSKADELDRMAELGFQVALSDVQELRE